MRSIGITSLGSSTTQITSASRRSSWQIRQVGSVARLKQISHAPHGALDLADGVGERQRLLVGHAQEVEGEPLRGALADAGQAPELGDQAVDGWGEQGLCRVPALQPWKAQVAEVPRAHR